VNTGRFTLGSASGNTFAYLWEDEAPEGFDGPAWARALCPRGTALGVDGLFLLARPVPGRPWVLEHWDTDGGRTFCSNGSRGALALPGAPEGPLVAASSSGVAVTLGRREGGFAIRMPQGPGFGFKASPLALTEPHACGWIGNPQLVVEVPKVAEVAFAAFAVPLRFHPGFAGGTNVNLVEVLGPGSARIRSWERGVEAETLCCGTGCGVAGAWLAKRTGVMDWVLVPESGEPVTVSVALGEDGDWTELWLSGGARVLGTFQPSANLTGKGLELA